MLQRSLRLAVNFGSEDFQQVVSHKNSSDPAVSAGRPGSEAALAKLSELLFVETVRRYVEGLPDGQTGWLAGLREPYVARALALLHRDITRRWTVDDLGREVGLSRSALADRFIRLIGYPKDTFAAAEQPRLGQPLEHFATEHD